MEYGGELKGVPFFGGVAFILHLWRSYWMDLENFNLEEMMEC